MEIDAKYRIKFLEDVSIEIHVDGDNEVVDYIDKKAGDVWEVEVYDTSTCDTEVRFIEKAQTEDELTLITNWVDIQKFEIVAWQECKWVEAK